MLPSLSNSNTDRLSARRRAAFLPLPQDRYKIHTPELRSTMDRYVCRNGSAQCLKTSTDVYSRDLSIRNAPKLSFPFNTLTLCSNPPVDIPRRPTDQYEPLTVSQPEKTTWNDLPPEILVLIAKMTIVPYESTSTDQYPHVDEIDPTFGAIGKRTRQAFFSAIRENCIFINLLFYDEGDSATDLNFAMALQRYFPSQRSLYLANACLLAGFSTSVIRMQYFSNLANCGWRAGNVVLCATQWNITMMRSFLVAYKNNYKNLIIDCRSRSRNHVDIMRLFVLGTQAFTRGMKFTSIFSSPAVMRVTEASLLSQRMMRSSNYHEFYMVHQAHLSSIQVLMKTKSIQKLLPYAADAALDHTRCFERIDILLYTNRRVARQRAVYYTLLQKGFVAYLLLQPNTTDAQSHCLFIEGSHGHMLLMESWLATGRAKTQMDNWDWSLQYDNDNDTETLLEAVFSMLQARTEYELALARTASLPDSRKISLHVKRERGHRYKKTGVKQHLKLCSKLQLALAKTYVARLGRNTQVTVDSSVYHRWSDVMTGLTYEFEKAATERRRKLKWMRKAIMVEPIAASCVNGLECTWKF